VYTQTNTQTHTPRHLDAFVNTGQSAKIELRAHTQKNISMHTHTNMRTHAHTHTHTHAHAHMHTHTHMHMHRLSVVR